MRVLGKGKTALAIQKIHKDVKLFDDDDINEYDKNSNELTVVSPGIPPYNRIVKSSKNIISDYDLFLSNIYKKQDKDIFTIWISGTNGKTTTTSMLEHILKKENFLSAGNIGLPLANAMHLEKNLILETSSFTLHYTSYAKPNIYILLPISDDHLSWHGTFSKYEQSKLKPLSSMNENDIAIIPSKYEKSITKAKIITYENTKDLCKKYNINDKKIQFKEPFLIDAVLALCVKKILFNNIDYDSINTFKQDAHKLEEFLDTKNRMWIDDSRATNVDAVIQALKTYKGKKIYLILGGDDKGADLNPLFEMLKLSEVCIYTIGTNASRLYKLSIKNNINCEICNSLEIAVNAIKNIHTSNDNNIAMLSPAASSYDQFNSYKQRGELFKQWVLE